MGDPPKAPPIEEQPYLGGTTVVHIEDLRVARGESRRPYSACRHVRLAYDRRERRIWCQDCETDVEAFDAFEQIVNRFARHAAEMKRREESVVAAEAHAVRSRAAKAVDEVWRSRLMLPACPACGSALFPEDFADRGVAMIGREYAEAARKKREGRNP